MVIGSFFRRVEITLNSAVSLDQKVRQSFKLSVNVKLCAGFAHESSIEKQILLISTKLSTKPMQNLTYSVCCGSVL